MTSRWLLILALAGAAVAAPRLNRHFGQAPLRFESASGGSLLARDGPYRLVLEPGQTTVTIAGVSVTTRLAGATASRVEGIDPLQAKASYLTGSDPARWRSAAPLYSRAIYREVYPHIDLLFHGSGQALEYDFIVRPGGDPRSIALDIAGANDIRLEADGTLAIATEAGEIRWRKPEIYQERAGRREPVSGRFVVRGHRVTFAVGAYDLHRTVVVDPTLKYASYLGGSADDASRGIAVDSAGNIYVTGFTFSRDLPGTGGFLQPSYHGGGAMSYLGGDAFVAKYSKNGVLAYVTYIGGSDDDAGMAIAVDASGSAYVTGYTNSTDFPIVKGCYQTSFQGKGSNRFNPAAGGDAFVAKLDPTGTRLVYSTYLGGKDDDKGTAIAVDTSGNAYVGGVTQSANFPVQNAYQTVFQGLGGVPELCGGCGPVANFGDAFLTALNPSGTGLLFSTYFGGSLEDTLTAIALDTAGNVYAGGSTLSTNFPVRGAFQDKFGGVAPFSVQPVIPTGDGWVAKFDKTGKLLYSTYLGGSRDDAVMGLAVDSTGAVYAAGFTSSPDFPGVPASAAQSKFHGPNSLAGSKGFIWGDAFVAKLTPAGNGLVYATYLGGGDDDAAMALAIDAAGNAYVAGFTDSADFPVSSDATQKTFAGKDTSFADPTGDAFLAKIGPDGSAILFSTYYGGSLDDAAGGIALDTQGNVYIAGASASANLQVPGAAQRTFGGWAAQNEAMGDAFIAGFSGLFPAIPVATITAVVNAASLDSRLSPGAAAIVKGNDLASAAPSALVGGKQAQVVSAGASQWNIVIPLDAAIGPAGVQVGTASPFNITLAQYAPALYSADGSGTGTAAATHASGGAISAASAAVPGENIVLTATGIGAVDGNGAVLAPLAATIGGTGATVVSSALTTNGVYQVSVQLPVTLPAGTQPVSLSIGDAASNPVTVPVAATGPTIGSIVNAANLQARGAAPNSFVDIQVTNLGSQHDSGNVFPDTVFEGVSVLFKGVPAPLYYVSSSRAQITLVLPSELPTSGTVDVQVQSPTGSSRPFALSMAPADVGLYRVSDPSNANRINGDVHFANSAGRVMPAAMGAALNLPPCGDVDLFTACGQPAKVGDGIVILLTGLGLATPNGDPNGQPLPTGTLVPADGSVTYQTVDTPVVTIGGVPAQVSSSVIAPGNAGLYLIATVVPDGVAPGDDVSVAVTMPNGSSDTVTIAVAGN